MNGAAAAPGVFGKLASQGDFVTRRLPPDFVQAWDAWLQQGLQALRARRGAAWLDGYLHAPVWRFALAPGMCGVLLPSVDRVGRHFPLTLAMATEAPLAVAAGAGEWFDALAELALRAMCGELSVADLDVALLALGAPRRHASRADPGWIALDSALGACVALAQSVCPAGMEEKSLFWTEGTPTLAPALFVSDGLPDAQVLGAMLGAGP